MGLVLFVVARASSEESESKLKRDGADRTILPYRIGGRRIAMLTLRPLVVDFIFKKLTKKSPFDRERRGS